MSPLPMWVGAILIVIALVLVGAIYLFRRHERKKDEQFESRLEKSREESEADLGHAVELEQPRIKGATFGLPEVLYRMYRHRKKKQKLASDGYIQWFLVDSSWPKPRFVRPEAEAGIPEYKKGDERYLFPRDSLVASELNGMWTAVHRKGEFDPVSLKDSRPNTISASDIQDYLQKRVTISPPGWLEGMFGDMTPKDLLRYGIIAIVAYAVMMQIMGGGMF